MLSFVANLMIFRVFDLFTDTFSSIGTLTSVFNISTVSRHLMEKTLKMKTEDAHLKKILLNMCKWDFITVISTNKEMCLFEFHGTFFPSLALRYRLLCGFQMNQILCWYGTEKCWHQNTNKHNVESQNKTVHHGLASMAHSGNKDVSVTDK